MLPTTDHSLDWLYEYYPDHLVTRFLQSAKFDGAVLVDDFSPIDHAGILPHVFTLRDEGTSFRYTYTGSWVDTVAGVDFDTRNKSLHDVVSPKRVDERLAVLRTIVDERRMIIQSESVPVDDRAHVPVLFVGFPLGPAHISDVCCIMSKL